MHARVLLYCVACEHPPAKGGHELFNRKIKFTDKTTIDDSVARLVHTSTQACTVHPNAMRTSISPAPQHGVSSDVFCRCLPPFHRVWCQPDGFEVAGSFLLRTLVRPSLNIDLALRIPSECLGARDSLNHRYFDKRALYAGHLARAFGAQGSTLATMVDNVEVSCAGRRGEALDAATL